MSLVEARQIEQELYDRIDEALVPGPPRETLRSEAVGDPFMNGVTMLHLGSRDMLFVTGRRDEREVYGIGLQDEYRATLRAMATAGANRLQGDRFSRTAPYQLFILVRESFPQDSEEEVVDRLNDYANKNEKLFNPDLHDSYRLNRDEMTIYRGTHVGIAKATEGIFSSLNHQQPDHASAMSVLYEVFHEEMDPDLAYYFSEPTYWADRRMVADSERHRTPEIYRKVGFLANMERVGRDFRTGTLGNLAISSY